MWSMEYNPSLFSMLESDSGTSGAKSNDENVLKQCGKFERKNLQVTKKDEIPLSVYIVASVLEIKNKRLLSEAKGLDDVVKVCVCLSLSHTHARTHTIAMMMIVILSCVHVFLCKQILNDITGSLDAKKACRGALQIHEKYLNTVSPLLMHKTRDIHE
jgi:hypothetical protein